MRNVIPTSQCSGCYACENICPKSCISMQEDDLGFIYPTIDESLCINCGKCERACPSLHPERLAFRYPEQAFAVWALQSSVRSGSSSGGFATAAGLHVVEREGIVYSSSFEDGCVKHVRSNEKGRVSRARGSKYVHSYIGDSYMRCREDLHSGKQVLFIGTGCQIAGLLSYLGSRPSNLVTVDLICHGVPSHKMLDDAVNRLIGTKDEVKNLSFRSGERFVLTVEGERGTYRDRLAYDRYMKTFLDGVTYRENCYSCPYARPERVSDITIGDFWGLGELKTPGVDPSQGVNVVLLNTERGQQFFDSLKLDLFYEERSVAEAIAGNNQLRSATVQPKERGSFLEAYRRGDSLQESADRCYGITFGKRVTMFVCNVLGKFGVHV